MAKKVDLSIIIVNYNTEDLLKQCLESIYSGCTTDRRGYTIEIIVVDNGSTDGSVGYLRDLERKSGKSISLKVIFNQQNLGFAKANNQGIKLAAGRYILFLNPDTVVLSDTLPTMMKFMDKHPDVGAATCWIELPNGQLDQACHRGFPTPWNAFSYFTGLAKIFPKSRFFASYSLTYLPLDKIHEIDSGCGAFLMVRREAGEEIEWFDEDYFWYGEDLDFCYRLKQKGWKIIFVPTTKIIHYKGAASGILKHSQKISLASKETKVKAAKASVMVMRIFFEKHYKNKYPKFIYWLVMIGVSLLKKIRLAKIH